MKPGTITSLCKPMQCESWPPLYLTILLESEISPTGAWVKVLAAQLMDLGEAIKS